MPDDLEGASAPEEAAVDDRDLHEVLLDAVSDWLGDTGMVTAFHFVADTIDSDGDEAYLSAVADGQTQSRTLGLIAWAQKIADYEAREHLRNLSEGED